MKTTISLFFGMPTVCRMAIYAALFYCVLAFVPQYAAAECACVCDANGSLVRACDSVEAAQADIAAETNHCASINPLHGVPSCPASSDYHPVAYTGALPDGATDCTSSAIYDPVVRGFRQTVLCEVTPE